MNNNRIDISLFDNAYKKGLQKKIMNSLVDALMGFKRKRIVVIGDVMLDKYTWGRIDALNPEQPAAPKVRIKPEATYALGGAGNVANNVSSLGAYCILYGVGGDDEYGNKIRQMCGEKGISLALFNNHRPTIMKERIMAHGQQVVRLEHGEWELEKIDEGIQIEVLRSLEESLGSCDFLILSDYDKVFFEPNLARRIIGMANLKQVPILVDAKPQNRDIFRGCTLIRVNEKEAEIMAGIRYSNGRGLDETGRKLSELIDSRYVVITCGEEGVYGYERDGNTSFTIKTKAREVADVTGAGDTFAAALALGLASKLDIKTAIELANYAAGIVVEKVGTAMTTIEEIEERILTDEKV